MNSGHVPVDQDWLNTLNITAIDTLSQLERIITLLQPEAWQPWQLNRLQIKTALDIAREAHHRLGQAIVPFDVDKE